MTYLQRPLCVDAVDHLVLFVFYFLFFIFLQELMRLLNWMLITYLQHPLSKWMLLIYHQHSLWMDAIKLLVSFFFFNCYIGLLASFVDANRYFVTPNCFPAFGIILTCILAYNILVSTIKWALIITYQRQFLKVDADRWSLASTLESPLKSWLLLVEQPRQWMLLALSSSPTRP